MKSFTDLVNVVEAAKEDAAKFQNGNKAAGTRLRVKMQEIKELAKEVRKEVSDIKNDVI